MSERLTRVLNEKAAWSLATFGSVAERGPKGPLNHLLKELEELRDNPRDLMEYVDCLFLIDDAAMRANERDYDNLASELVWEWLTDDWDGQEFWAVLTRASVPKDCPWASFDDLKSTTHLCLRDCDTNNISWLYMSWAALGQQLGHFSGNLDDLAEACEEKLALLKTRTYPKTPNGVPSEHVK
jgi:hypothetical protein